MLRRLIKQVKGWVPQVKDEAILKGTDKYGNRYYEFTDDDMIKRKIEFAEGNHGLEYESEFWHEWLKYQTEHPIAQGSIDQMVKEREKREGLNKAFDQKEQDIHEYNLKNNIK